MTLEKVKKMIAAQLNIDAANIADDANIIIDLKADSLDVFQVLMEIESEFGIEIPDEKMQDLRTVKDVVDYIESVKK